MFIMFIMFIADGSSLGGQALDDLHDDLVDRTLKPWRVHRTSLDSTILGKGLGKPLRGQLTRLDSNRKAATAAIGKVFNEWSDKLNDKQVQSRLCWYSQNPKEAAAQLRAVFDVWAHIKPSSLKEEDCRVVQALTLKQLCRALAATNEELGIFPEFLADEFLFGRQYLDIRNKGYGELIENVIAEFIGTYYDRAPLDLKLRMTAKLLELIAESRDALAKTNETNASRSSSQAGRRLDRYEALRMFHEAGPLFHKYIQMFATRVEHSVAREVVNTFKSSIAPMLSETLKAVMADAHMLVNESDTSSDLFLNLDKLGTYRISTQPHSAGSIAQGHLARVVSNHVDVAHKASITSYEHVCDWLRRMQQAIFPCCVISGPALRNKELETTDNPNVFLKVLRPRLVSYLQMERAMLKRATIGKVGARAILDNHWNVVLREVDLEREERMQRHAAAAYSGLRGIHVARPLGLWRSARKAAKPNQEYKASVLAMEVAAGVDFQILLREAAKGTMDLTRARKLYELASRLWMEKALQKGEGFVHGDPHLGNLFYSEDGPLTFIDFGNAESVPKKYDIAEQLKTFLLGSIAGDADKVLQVFPLSDPRATSEFKKVFNQKMINFSSRKYMSLTTPHDKKEYETEAWRTALHCVVMFQAFGTAPIVLYTFLQALMFHWHEGWLALHDPAVYVASERLKQKWARMAGANGGRPSRGHPRPPGPLDSFKARIAAKVTLSDKSELVMGAIQDWSEEENASNEEWGDDANQRRKKIMKKMLTFVRRMHTSPIHRRTKGGRRGEREVMRNNVTMSKEGAHPRKNRRRRGDGEGERMDANASEKEAEERGIRIRNHAIGTTHLKAPHPRRFLPSRRDLWGFVIFASLVVLHTLQSSRA